jgi:pimeloyl-ACP methyl ester carboxylesterase
VIRYTFERATGSGRFLAGDVRLPDSPPPRSAVVAVHGFKGFKDWGFFPHLAERLAAAGHAVVTFNFTGSGVAAGEDEVRDLDAFAQNTLGRELDELALVVELTRAGELLPRPPRALGLIGHSRGGGDAILHTAERGGVDALVTWAALSSYDRWSEETREEWRAQGRVLVLNTRTGQQLPLNLSFLEDYERQRERLDPLRAAGKVAVPWLIVHGLDDTTVSAEEGRALARAARSARLLLIEAAGHTFEVSHPMRAPSRQLEEAVAATLRHFERHLTGGAGPGSPEAREANGLP